TAAVLNDQGTVEKMNNLAACLRTLRERRELRERGFLAVGGVPPGLSLWSKKFADLFNEVRPEMVLQVGHSGRVNGIVTSADGLQAMTAGRDATVRVWSVADRALLRVFADHMVDATALALSDNGHALVSADGRAQIVVHDLARDGARVLQRSRPHLVRVKRL